MKYDLRKIMLRAWRIYRENKELSFGESPESSSTGSCQAWRSNSPRR